MTEFDTPSRMPVPETEPAAVATPQRSVLGPLWEVVQVFLLALLMVMLIRNVVQNYRIDGISMEPNFHDGQFLIVNRYAYCPGIHLEIPIVNVKLFEKTWCTNQPRRGDVIIFEYPRDPSRDFIKRVIGLPGETVELRRKVVHINGQPLEEPYVTLLQPPRPGGESSVFDLRESYGPVVVPPGHYFVMGDNRDNSRDSRYWGFLPGHYVKGKALFVYWSYDAGPEAAAGARADGLLRRMVSTVTHFFTRTRWERMFHQIR